MRKAKWNALILVPALALASLGVQAAASPRHGEQAQPEQAAKKEPGANVYRVNYKVSEVENGKTINARSYTLMVKAGSTAMSRVRSQVPFDSGPRVLPRYEYQNVGTDINCTVTEQEGKLLVSTRLDVSTLASEGPAVTSGRPVKRELMLTDVAAAAIGKPTFVGSIDAAASNRRYVVEVTVTKAR